MVSFPALSTGCVAQYPSRRETETKTRVLTYVDGSEQRFRQLGVARRRWIIRLQNATEREVSAIEAFFVLLRGSADTFSFFDPWDGKKYDNCSLESDQIELRYVGHGRCATALVIRTNPK